MSTAAWIRRQRDRPIAEHERRGAMAAVVVLSAVALLLALTQPSSPHQRAAHGQRSSAAGSASGRRTLGGQERTTPMTPVIEEAADRFLAGYLSYAYGHAPASQIKGATTGLLHSLQERPPRVPPGMQQLKPRLLSLHTTPAAPGLVGVSALVTDGRVVDYPVGLLLSPQGDRLLVSGLDGE